ncbi:MAG: hypothetical protein O2904_00740 [bacterium]|nr:hypothetical protein [bacterium]
MSARTVLIVLVALGIQAPSCIGVSYAADLVESTSSHFDYTLENEPMSPGYQTIYTCDTAPDDLSDSDLSSTNTGCQDANTCIRSTSSSFRETIVSNTNHKSNEILFVVSLLPDTFAPDALQLFHTRLDPPLLKHARYYAHILVKRE